MKKTIFTLLTLVLISFSLSTTAKVEQREALLVSQLVDEFYSSQVVDKLFNQNKSLPKNECDDDGQLQSCTEFACSKLGALSCNELDEIQEVNRACRGNYNSSCIEFACGKLGALGCNEIEEISQVAQACRGNINKRCMESTCRRLGALSCNEMDEIIEVGNSCGGFGDY